LVGEGLTLHGLRVTYAAALKRDGANTSNVAAALGDRDERMGAHYTRHVENETRVIQAFGKPKKKKRTVLENGKA
jgi:integrase